jgi:hypothetical protein
LWNSFYAVKGTQEGLGEQKGAVLFATIRGVVVAFICNEFLNLMHLPCKQLGTMQLKLQKHKPVSSGLTTDLANFHCPLNSWLLVFLKQC